MPDPTSTSSAVTSALSLLSATSIMRSSNEPILRGAGDTSDNSPPSTRHPRLPRIVPNHVLPSPGNDSDVDVAQSVRPRPGHQPLGRVVVARRGGHAVDGREVRDVVAHQRPREFLVQGPKDLRRQQEFGRSAGRLRRLRGSGQDSQGEEDDTGKHGDGVSRLGM